MGIKLCDSTKEMLTGCYKKVDSSVMLLYKPCKFSVVHCPSLLRRRAAAAAAAHIPDVIVVFAVAEHTVVQQ